LQSSRLCASAFADDVAEARRQAVNTIVQGTAADLLKLALIRLHNALPEGVRMLLPVHDSILLCVPEGLVEEARSIVQAAMETPPAGFSVPLKVEIKTGRTWAECKCGRRQADVAWRRDLCLALLHPLVASQQQRLGLGIFLLT